MDIKKTFKDFVNEANLNEGKFDGIADLVKALHFETDSKTAEEMKMAIGKSQGEFNKKKQIEGGEYSLRRFRKEIKFGDGTYLGVFLPGSYDAATSVLGDGPHKKAVKKVKWNQKKYDQWLEDSASNGGADNAFDMAQNAKNEIGLIDWVKKEFRGDDPLQRIQWDIEGYAESIEVYESVTTEGKYYGMIAGDAASDIAKELSFYVKKIIKQSNSKVTYFHVKDQPSVNKTMYSLRDLYGIESQSGDRKFSPYKTVKFDNDQIISETVTENRELIKIDSYLNTKDERVLIDFCDDAYGNSDDRKTKKEWNDARNDLSYNELVDYAVAHAENFGMDLQDIEDAIEVYESLVTEAKNTIGLAFKEEQDYLDFKEFVTEQPRGTIRKNIGFDSKTKSWEVIMDIKVLDDIYGEGHPGNKESGWYGALPTDFESVIIEGFVSEAFIGPFVFNDTMSDEELKAMYDGALDGYANWQKGFQHPKAKYKQAYQEIEKLLKKRGVEESVVTENFPGPGETVDAKYLDYDMLDYFNRTNKVLSIDTKTKKGIKGSVGKMHNDLVFNGDDIQLKDIIRIKILESVVTEAFKSSYVTKQGSGYVVARFLDKPTNQRAIDSLVKDLRKKQKEVLGKDPGGGFSMDLDTIYSGGFSKKEADELLKSLDESVVTEGREVNKFGIESHHIGKLQNGKMNKFTEGTGMPFGLISRPEGGLSDTDKNAVKDYVNADNIVLGFYPMEDSNNDTMYDAVKAEGVKVITDLVSKEYGLKLIETIKGKRHCAGDTCSLTHYLVFSKTNESVVNEHPSQDSRELNEGELNSKVAKKLTIGDTIKTDKHTYTITDFGQKANAFRQFQVEDEAGEIYQIQVSLYGSNRIGVGAGRSLNFRDEVLETLVTEAKTAIRAEVMDFLETKLKLVRTSEEFDGAEGGIWTSAENGETLGGSKIFDYYSESSKYEFGVLNKFAKELSKLGWYCEFYDPGTVMIWEE